VEAIQLLDNERDSEKTEETSVMRVRISVSSDMDAIAMCSKTPDAETHRWA
jgi:hypothetical protein